MTNWHPSFCWYELSVPVPDYAHAPQTAGCQTTRRVSALQDHPDYFLIFAGREDLMFREGQMQQFSHHQTMPTNSSDTPTSTATVTMRLKTAECTTSRAACKLKNLLRLLARTVCACARLRPCSPNRWVPNSSARISASGPSRLFLNICRA